MTFFCISHSDLKFAMNKAHENPVEGCAGYYKSSN